MDYLTFDKLPIELQNLATYEDIAAQQIIFQQQEATRSIYFLLEGQLRLASFTQERIINHFFILPGESFAEIALFADTYFCTAIADLPSRIAIINKEVFHQALRDYPELDNLYMNQLTYRFKTVKTLLDLRSIRSARERLLQYLILQIEPSSRTLILQRPLKDLAIELGLSAEALSRTLARLQEEGMITRRQRSITLNEDWLTIDNE
ncbi:MAG: Crp/Fnr family transcriptional regulator [Cyanobacteria bacterium P01_A01_bin.83]